MNNKYRKTTTLIILGVIFLTILSCSWNSRSGEANRESTSFEREGVESASVNLRMGAGDLSIQGGSDSLVDAEFIYDEQDWKPLVDYSVSGDQANLWIEQPSNLDLSLDGYQYQWNLQVNPDVRLDFNIKFGAGQGNLDFSQVSLTSFDMEVGVGDVDIDLTGNRALDVNGNIRGGVGALTIFLPEEVGAKVNVRGGLGNVNTSGLTQSGDGFVNDAYDDSVPAVNLDIEGGLGSIELIVGNS
jgi:hypothetical protein